MPGRTNIEWTDLTLNPGLYGCTIVSPACENCYAAKMAHRLGAMSELSPYWGSTEERANGVHWTGRVRVVGEGIDHAFSKLPKPRRDGRPVLCFLTSMSDLFHADVPDAFIDRVFDRMASTPHVIFQVLTKRAARAREWWLRREILGKPWPGNVWIGTTVEDQRRANERAWEIAQIPAPVRFLSMEPLLGPVDPVNVEGQEDWLINVLFPKDRYHKNSIDWVIAGGESGPSARPSHPRWFQALRDQCAANGVPFFFKQWGAYAPCAPDHRGAVEVPSGIEGVPAAWMAKQPKVENLLDGARLEAFPPEARRSA